MIQLITPKWFYSDDVIMGIISIFVLCLIGFFSMKYYKLEKKNKNYLFLALSFFLIALSFLAKVLMNFTIIYKLPVTRYLGPYMLTYQAVRTSDILFYGGYLVHRLLMLIGLYVLYSIHQKSQSKSNIFLITFFIFVSTYSSQSAYYIFHLTALAILSIISAQFYLTYKKNRELTTKLLALSFGVIALSQVSFMFAGFKEDFYVIGDVIQLLGYLILLTAFIRVLQNAKKKG